MESEDLKLIVGHALVQMNALIRRVEAGETRTVGAIQDAEVRLRAEHAAVARGMRAEHADALKALR